MTWEKMTGCMVDGVSISLEDALAQRDAAQARGVDAPDFRCPKCDESVRPYSSEKIAPHFEHLTRNPDCEFSVAYYEERKKVSP